MRKMREQLNKKYAKFSMEERLRKIHEDTQKTELWKKLHTKDRIHLSR